MVLDLPCFSQEGCDLFAIGGIGGGAPSAPGMDKIRKGRNTRRTRKIAESRRFFIRNLLSRIRIIHCLLYHSIRPDAALSFISDQKNASVSKIG